MASGSNGSSGRDIRYKKDQAQKFEAKLANVLRHIGMAIMVLRSHMIIHKKLP